MRQPKNSRSESLLDSPGAARDKAIELLARREHSRRELTDKLSQRGFEASLIAEVIDQLAAEGLQSEQRFTESFVSSRAGRGYGELRIRAELGQRGVGGELLAEAFREAAIDWFERAEQALAKKWRSGVPAQDPRGRGMRFLAGRGFTGEQSREAVHALLNASDDD